jgi:hypothetical protein
MGHMVEGADADMLKNLRGPGRDELIMNLLKGILVYQIESGELDPSLPDAEFARQFWMLIEHVARSEDAPLLGVVDHDESLLAAAALHREDYPDLYVTILAIWIEHWLNKVIATATMRLGHDNDVIVELIRTAPMQAKLGGSLWKLLGLGDIDGEMVTLIRGIMEFRNSFVHYKWQPRDVSDVRVERQRAALMERSDEVIEYLRSFRRSLYLKAEPNDLLARVLDK